MKTLFLGNCQMMSCEALMRMAGYSQNTVVRLNQITRDILEPEHLKSYDMVLVHNVRNRADSLRPWPTTHEK